MAGAMYREEMQTARRFVPTVLHTVSNEWNLKKARTTPHVT